MDTTEIKELLKSQGKAWEEFKATNDERLAELEKKGGADPLLEEKLEKLNGLLDQNKSRLEKIETKLARPNLASGSSDNQPVDEYKAAFVKYIKTGYQSPELEQKAMSVGIESDGGYLVTPTMEGGIRDIVRATSPVRSVASIVSVSTDGLDVLINSTDAGAGWTTERGAITETTSPQIRKTNIPTHEMYAEPQITRKLIDDSSFNIESWLQAQIADRLMRLENAAFVNGDGVGKPRGFTTHTTASTADGVRAEDQIQYVASGAAANWTNPDVIHTMLYSALKAKYAVGARWMCNRAVLGIIRNFKMGDGQYLWQPGLAAGQPDTIAGLPVAEADDMPDNVTTASSYPLALANWTRAYQIVDRMGIQVLRDQYTNKPFIKYYTTKRVGGDVVDFRAIKLLKIAAS